MSNIMSFDQHNSINESKGIVPGMDFFVELIKKELFRVKKEVIAIRDQYSMKRFKKPEDRYDACVKALIEKVINVPVVINIENPPVEFPLHKLTIVFDEVRGGAKATYKKERTHFDDDGKIIQATIGLKLDIKLDNFKNPLEVRDLAYSRVPHELTHIYQHYKWKDKVDYEKNRQVAKKEFGRVAIWNKQAAEKKGATKSEKNDSEARQFLTNYISKAIYYFSEKEIGAKVTQTYYELLKEKAIKPTKDPKTGSISQKDLMEKLKKTTHWESLQSYIFNLDTLYDLIKHGHTVVMIEDGRRVKMKFSDDDLKAILQDVDRAIDAQEEKEEKAINKRKVDVPNRPVIPPVDKREEIFSKYNLNTDNPRSIFLKLLRYFDEQIEAFRRRILRLAVELPLSYPEVKKVVKKGIKKAEKPNEEAEEEKLKEEEIAEVQIEQQEPVEAVETIETEDENKEN